MTRAARVAVELLAPPLLGAAPFLLLALLTWSPGIIPFILLVAYVVALPPGVVFTVVLELAFWRGLDPRGPAALLLAASLGLGAGSAIGLLGGQPGVAGRVLAFGPLGLVAGCGTALIVRWRSNEAR